MSSAAPFHKHQVRRILIYRLGSLGDTVVALPCFHLIAKTFPESERRLLTNIPISSKAPASAAILGGSGLVHDYMRYSVGTRNPIELLALAARIRSYRPDLLIFINQLKPWSHVARDRRFFRFCGLRHIVGISNEQEQWLQFDPVTGLYEPEATRLARLIGEIGDARVDDLASWSLRLTEQERGVAAKALKVLEDRPLIVCGPGTKMQSKDWGRDNWRALLGRLHARYPHHALALVGSPAEAELAEFAAQDWAGPKVSLCGQLSPRETAAVIERARAFLGPDSGPMHLAASVGVPCVIAFSAAGLLGAWFPVGTHHQVVYHRTSCHGCRLETCTVEQRRCLTSITVDEMAEAAVRVLGQGTHANPLPVYPPPTNSAPGVQ